MNQIPYYYNNSVNYQCEQSATIIDGSEQYQRFVNLPQPLQFNVYIFNVSNPMEVQQGDLPIVTEIGPYVYR